MVHAHCAGRFSGISKILCRKNLFAASCGPAWSRFTLIMARCYGGPLAGPRPAGHWRRPSERTRNSSRYFARPGAVLTLIVRLCVIVVMVALAAPAPEAAAQTPPVPQQAVQPPGQPAPAPLPPTDIGPVLRGIEIRIVPDNVFTSVPAETYQYYIRTVPSQPVTRGTWVPYNTTTEASLLADFDRLFTTP